MKTLLHKLSWKQKNRILLVAIIVLLWVVYAFAISNTIAARSDCDRMQLQLDSVEGAPDKLAELKSELTKFSLLTGGTNDTLRDMHEQLLNFVSVYCNDHNLQLREFTQPVRYAQQEWSVETHPLTVEGNYISIVQFIRALELSSMGRIVSVDFHTRIDNKTKSKSLLATIYVQNITNVAS